MDSKIGLVRDIFRSVISCLPQMAGIWLKTLIGRVYYSLAH